MAFPQVRPVPGLNASLEKSDLGKASGVYNKATAMDEFPAAITDNTLERLGQIFVQHGAHLAFALGLIHSHGRLSTDEILVNESLQLPGSGSWMRTAKIEAIDMTEIRGQFFKINEVGDLVAYKFCHGPLPNLEFNLAAFVNDLTTHINELGLGDYLCLQLREDTPSDGVEFDLGEVGTVLIPEAAAKYGQLTHTTAWAFGTNDKGITTLKGQTKHANTTKGTHRVFVDSKADTQPALVNFLRQNGLLIK